MPKVTVMQVLLLGVLIGTFLLPATDQTYLNLFKSWGLPLIELGVLAFVGVSIRNVVLTYRELKQGSPDFYVTVRKTCADFFPGKIAHLMASEFTLIYYTRAAIKDDDDATSLSLLGEFEGHNIIISCRDEQLLNGPYGLTKTYRRLALNIDDKEAFMKAVSPV